MGKVRTAALAVSALLWAVNGAPASAATTVGQTAATPGEVFGCGGATLFTQATEAPGTSSYTIPSDGVLTSWSIMGNDVLGGPAGLKVVREGPSDVFTIIAATPLVSTPPNVLSTFPIRISVVAGDEIALWIGAGAAPCYYIGGPGDEVRYRGGSYAEPAVGQTFPVSKSIAQSRLDLSAALEADADGDGYGDDTQDLCPADPQRQGDCDPPETAITKQPKDAGSKRKVQYKFISDEAGSTFECKLKGKGVKDALRHYGPCTSPRRYKRLHPGTYRFKVRATDAAGNTDMTPAKDKFKVVD